MPANESTRISTPLALLDFTKSYNISCYTRVTKFSGPGEPRLEFLLGQTYGDSSSIVGLQEKFFKCASNDWSLFSYRLDAGGWGEGPWNLTIAGWGNSENWHDKWNAFEAEIDNCSIAIDGISEAGQPW